MPNQFQSNIGMLVTTHETQAHHISRNWMMKHTLLGLFIMVHPPLTIIYCRCPRTNPTELPVPSACMALQNPNLVLALAFLDASKRPKLHVWMVQVPFFIHSDR